MGQLYVLAEINGEIRLVVLDAETGRLQWSQQLAHVDTRDIRNDPGRRSAGASPPSRTESLFVRLPVER